MLTSVYNGNSVEELFAAQAWLGGGLDAIQLHTGTRDWSDWLSCVEWQGGLFDGHDIDIMWSIPLIPYGANLGAAAHGEYDDHYLAMAKQLILNAGDSDEIYVRLGWEFNGDGWNSSSAVGQPENYIAAFRNFVDAARSLSDKFVFEWCPNIGPTDMDPETAYPGDDYVDVIGVDMYYNTQWDSTDPNEAWNWFVTQPFGLQWHQDFAAAHGKKTAIGEWGMNIDSPEFVKLLSDWAVQHGMVYQNYWDSDAAFQGKMSDGQYPDAAAAFKALFAGIAPVLQPSEILGNDLADTLNGTSGDDTMRGFAGKDILYGEAGNDSLDGGTGADIMAGGDGDDTYHVDDIGDELRELFSNGLGGTDMVFASIDYTLGRYLENLTLTGTAIKGVGNEWANVLRGNGEDNVLWGQAGDDTLYGEAGNDTLSGGSGADAMVGGTGNDTYHVENTGDRVIEAAGEGIDAIYALVDYALSANVENLHLSGKIGLRGTGNELANMIYGTIGNDTIFGFGGDDFLRGFAGDDRLDGGEGNDILYGHAGQDILNGGIGADVMEGGDSNDTYHVDDIGDVVRELFNSGLGGTDLVFASIDYTLGNNVENLTLTGAATRGTGNALANVLHGNDEGNLLNGMGGNDTLHGGAGNDQFVFQRGSGNDTILDFSAGDRIVLSDYLDAGFQPTVRATSEGVTIGLGQGNSVFLQNVVLGDLVANASGYAFG